MKEIRTSKYRKQITEICKIICAQLKIKVPKICISNSFESDTQMARYIPELHQLELGNSFSNELDMYFAIAHELRHIYQYKNNLYDFSKYESNDNTDIHTYNNQDIEIDANAYAYIFIVYYFHMEPIFTGLSEDIINKIKKRAEKIAQE